MNVLNGDLVSTGTTADELINMTDAPQLEQVTFLIEVITGTIKIAEGEVGDNCYANPVGAKRMITCRNGNLCVRQGANGDNFVITQI